MQEHDTTRDVQNLKAKTKRCLIQELHLKLGSKKLHYMLVGRRGPNQIEITYIDSYHNKS